MNGSRSFRRYLSGIACIAVFAVSVQLFAQQGWTLVHEVDSQYQNITVWDSADGHRQLIFDGHFDESDAVQSDMSLAHPLELTLSYAQHMMTALPLVQRSAAQKSAVPRSTAEKSAVQEALPKTSSGQTTARESADRRQPGEQRSDPAQAALAVADGEVNVVDENRLRILVVGLGGACIQRFLHDRLPTAIIESVELDPVVRDVARQFFALKEDDRQIVHIADGREFLEKTDQQYDLIMLDAFSADSIPYMLSTREFLLAVKQRLKPGGVLCANLWRGVPEYADMLKTYDDVYPEWRLLHCADGTNAILVALPARRDLAPRQWTDLARQFDQAHPTGLNLAGLIDRGLVPGVRIPSRARILLDANRPR
jgi:SAM-dependent methyltransferase